VTPYSEKASVIAAYTREKGRISLMAYGMHSKRNTARKSTLMPLSLVSIVAGKEHNKEMYQLKEIQPEYLNSNIQANPVKISQALFITELLYKTIRQSDTDTDLFDFLEQSILFLDQTEQNTASFHLIFCMQLSHFLGFEPNTGNNDYAFFDMMEGCFTQLKPSHPHVIYGENTQLFANLTGLQYSTMEQSELTRTQRNALLDLLLEYYRLHLPDFHGLKSTQVLRDIFS
jgi:DNA repair protein RecO (recombination protein O)